MPFAARCKKKMVQWTSMMTLVVLWEAREDNEVEYAMEGQGEL